MAKNQTFSVKINYRIKSGNSPDAEFILRNLAFFGITIVWGEDGEEKNLENNVNALINNTLIQEGEDRTIFVMGALPAEPGPMHTPE